MISDVGDHRTPHPRGDVVPAERPAIRMAGPVEAIASEIGEIDATDEGDLIVDDDDLLVVAVQGTLMSVDRTLDRRALGEGSGASSHLAPGGMKVRQRRAGPQKDPDVHPSSDVSEQVPHAQARFAALQREGRRQMPTGDVNVGAGMDDGLDHGRKCLRAIDEDVEATARARLGVTGRPDV